MVTLAKIQFNKDSAVNFELSQFLIEGRGSYLKPKCPIFLCPKVPREGGCQARKIYFDNLIFDQIMFNILEGGGWQDLSRQMLKSKNFQGRK